MRAVIACYQSAAPTWYERPVSPSSVQIRCPRQTTLRVQCLVDDRHRIEAVVRRGVRASLYLADGPAAAQLVEDFDDTLFCHLINFEQHVLHVFLPEQNEHGYNFRPRPNNLSLSRTMDHRNFIPRLAFKNCY